MQTAQPTASPVGILLLVAAICMLFKSFKKLQTAQYAMGPTSFSTSAISTMTMASHGQPSRKQPSGPLLRHFLQPMHWMGSIWMRPNGGLSSSGTQNMQSSTGQYSTQAGEPAQPVQHSVMTASSLGFFLRAVAIPLERGSCFSSSGTIPGAFATSGALAICRDFTLSVKPLPARSCGQSASRRVFTRRCGSADHYEIPRSAQDDGGSLRNALQCRCVRILFACTPCSPNRSTNTSCPRC